MDFLEGQFKLLGAAYDFAPSGGPNFRYMIASTPRSGSSLLAMRLWATGRLGAPLEYFNFLNWMPTFQLRLGAPTLEDYVRRILALRTSPNGVFGFKVHRTHLEFMRLANIWPGLQPDRIVHLVRRDRLAQAVSLVIAGQTGSFSSLDAPRRAPVYDARRIASAIAALDRAEASWRQVLEQAQIPVRRIAYEDLQTMADAQFDELAAFLSPDAAGGPRLELPRVERQSDAVNLAWIVRYRREAASDV